ncbi:hypothetical protein AWM68_06855 [Fictibacillus phosphorivorans]|uniref:Uncharacterized protein n=1 Tax=Fictibacillus phosphorivorans TaxID=1221500 RepID=A0A163R2G3_9BACL|nr:hypothetical protein AWM68_06855 [Fictibacillus phosphorivorans]
MSHLALCAVRGLTCPADPPGVSHLALQSPLPTEANFKNALEIEIHTLSADKVLRLLTCSSASKFSTRVKKVRVKNFPI